MVMVKFNFIQIADPQVGMFARVSGMEGVGQERKNLETALRQFQTYTFHPRNPREHSHLRVSDLNKVKFDHNHLLRKGVQCSIG
jgi:hypothetical protein